MKKKEEDCYSTLRRSIAIVFEVTPNVGVFDFLKRERERRDRDS